MAYAADPDTKGKNTAKHAKMTIFQVSIALVATTIGGGLLGVPYAFYHLGIPLAVFLSLMAAITGYMSVMLYLRTKDLTPRKYESTYEIAYLLYGRASIFIVTGTQFVSSLFCMILYYRILGDTIGHLWAQIFLKHHTHQN